MAYINTETLQYPMTESDIKALSPNTSFPKPFVVREPYAPVLNSPQPSYDPIYKFCREIAPVKDGANWMQVWEVVDLDPEQIEYNENQAKQRNKQQAEGLLQDTDWTQMPDVDLVNKADFTAYRAAVRAIALNPPVTVDEWPVKPDEIWG